MLHAKPTFFAVFRLDRRMLPTRFHLDSNRINAYLVSILLAIAWTGDFLKAGELVVDPPSVTLNGNFSQAQFVIRESLSNPTEIPLSARAPDRTADSKFRSADPTIAAVDESGCITAIGNGKTTIVIEVDDSSKQIDVEVTGVVANPKIDFHRDIQPLITRAGCNAGACHASQYGKGGFVLSVMGFDPSLDYQMMAVAARGRRISVSSPDGSLLLQKGTQQVSHGGGIRFPKDSNDFRIFTQWIANGAPPPEATPAIVTSLAIFPSKRISDVATNQQLRTVATYADGTQRDVTAWTRFDAMDESVVTVSKTGLATTRGKGQASVMARFADRAEIATFVIPFSDRAQLEQWVSQNAVDELARRKWEELGLTPSERCDDATFLRRAFLDTLGGLPSVEETKAFLSSQDPNKRALCIDRLLGLAEDPTQNIYNDRFSAYWSLKWSDLIRNNSSVLGESGMWALHNWLRDSFRTNKPMNQFAMELITAKGSIFSNGPANYYRIANNPPDLAETTAQLFLGTRLQCAKCHHHPYEKLSQADYYGFAAFFSRVASKNSAEFGIFGGETVVVVNSSGEVSHPKTGAVMKPTPLASDPTDDPIDRRMALAKWMTAPENASFSRNIVNRYVAYLLGRGLVEPIDDMRSTNPPSNPELMDHLVEEFKNSGFNIRHLMKTIMNSRLYQLDSQPNESNRDDQRFYSHYRVKRIGAEPLLDCIDDATSVKTKHPNLPVGTRAIELPDAASATTNPFLITFGKPKRVSVCECERTPDENLSQALHTLNGEIVATKIADANGRIAKLIGSGKSVDECVEELYLSSLSRAPNTTELAEARQFIASSPTPTDGLQDLLWALINSKHFLFIR